MFNHRKDMTVGIETCVLCNYENWSCMLLLLTFVLHNNTKGILHCYVSSQANSLCNLRGRNSLLFLHLRSCFTLVPNQIHYSHCGNILQCTIKRQRGWIHHSCSNNTKNTWKVLGKGRLSSLITCWSLTKSVELVVVGSCSADIFFPFKLYSFMV